MSKVMKRRWSSTLGGSGLPRKDTRPCEYEAYVPNPLVGRRHPLLPSLASSATAWCRRASAITSARSSRRRFSTMAAFILHRRKK